MRTFIAYPPLARRTGGTAVLEDMASMLAQAGYELVVVPRDRTRAPSLAGVATVPWEQATPAPQDIWLVPEGWPTLLLPGLQAGARTTIYVQNWAYLPGSLPEGVSFAAIPAHLIAVSQPVAWHAHAITGKSCEILRPGIDLSCFHPAGGVSPSGSSIHDHETIRIAWMPRKNKALASQIQDMLAARRCLKSLPLVEWIPIHHMSKEQVAETLRTCHIFLATGFPEGCPLPPLEAMASGCLVVGFSGFGGWDYMRQGLPEDFPGRFQPWWPERPQEELPQNGNGLYVADADTIAACMALEYALALLRRGGEELAAIQTAAAETALAYGLDAHRKQLEYIWARAAEGVALMPFSRY